MITGAGSGIGRSCLELFLAHGARVDAWDRSSEALADLSDRDDVTARVVDVTDAASVASAAEAASEAWGEIDFVVN
ncbi:SDR family NAD(P)-dependent oxidoreductase, partial [Rhodococcus koreensis]